jgi:lysophospholipase L1-like esterase
MTPKFNVPIHVPIVNATDEIPDADHIMLSAKADGRIYKKNNAGIEEAISISGAVSSSNIFLSNLNSDITGYKKLSYSIDTTQTEFSAVVNNNEVLLKKFIYDSAIGLSEILTGISTFSFYTKLSSSGVGCYIKLELFSRNVSTGDETTVFTVQNQVEGNIYTLSKFEYAISSPIIVNEADRFGLAVYVGKTTTTDKTVYVVSGDGTPSHFTLPIQISHDVVRRKNENPSFQHVDQTASKETPVDSDSIALWDSVGLKFLRLTITNFKLWIKSWISKEDISGLKLASSPECADFNITSLSVNPSIGNTDKSVLSAITKIIDKIASLNLATGATLDLVVKSNQRIDIANANWVAGAYLNGSTTTNHVDYCYCSKYFLVSDLKGLDVYSLFYNVVQYDVDKVYISNTYTGSNHVLMLSSNCVFVRVSANAGSANMGSQQAIIDSILAMKFILIKGNTYNVVQYDTYNAVYEIVNVNYKINNSQVPSDFVVPDNSIETVKIKNKNITGIKLSDAVNSSINSRITGVIGKNKANSAELLTGKYIGSDGSLVNIPAYPDYCVTGFIPITENQILKCNSNHGVAYNALYDANFAYISGTSVLSSTQSYLVGTSTSKYARFSFSSNYLNKLQVETISSISGVSTIFEPYNNTKDLVESYGIVDSILHPLQKILFPYKGLSWFSLTDSIGIDGIEYASTDLLYERTQYYSHRAGSSYYAWQRYVGDYLQLGGQFLNCVGGATIAANTSGVNSSYFVAQSRINTIPTTIPLVVVMGGTNDHYYNTPIGNMDYNGGYDETMFKGAIASLIAKIHTRAPNALIVMLTPLYASRLGVNSLGLTLKDYADAMLDVAYRMATPCINVYGESGINERNSSEYLNVDGVHPNNLAGMMKLATCIIAGLMRFRPLVTEIPIP